MVESRVEPRFLGIRAYALIHYVVNLLKWVDDHDILLNFKKQVTNVRFI